MHKQRKAVLVLGGGGAKGAFQVGAEKVLREEAGYKWTRIFGVSVGALNACALSRGLSLEFLWRTIKERDVFRRFGLLKLLWRLVRGKKGAYDNAPLYSTISNALRGKAIRIPAHVGYVCLTDGKYRLVPSEPKAVWASATMPIVWEPVDGVNVDGGVRNVTPLGDALEWDPREIVVILCTKRGDVASSEPPKNILDVTRRVLDILTNEIMNADVNEFLRINNLVKQAEAKGVVLTTPSGRPYRYVPITVIEPEQPLGDSLDFSQSAIAERIAEGERVARKVLGLTARTRKPGLLLVTKPAA